MATIFKFKEELFQAIDLKKKLKRLKINESDIEIIWEGNANKQELDKRFASLTKKEIKEENTDEIKLYKFTDGKYIIYSIFPKLDHLKDILNIDNYEKLD